MKSQILVDNGEDVALAEDGVGGAVVGDLRAAVFGNEDLIVHRHVEGDEVAVLIAAAGTDGANDGFLGFLLGGIRQEETTRCLGFGFYTLYEHSLS